MFDQIPCVLVATKREDGIVDWSLGGYFDNQEHYCNMDMITSWLPANNRFMRKCFCSFKVNFERFRTRSRPGDLTVYVEENRSGGGGKKRSGPGPVMVSEIANLGSYDGEGRKGRGRA